MAEIELTRPTGFRIDSGRAYQVVIDRKRVGSIRNGESKVFALPPGQHELQLKQDWGASERLQVDLDEKEQARFLCAPRIKENDIGIVNGFRAIYWMTLGCRRYIDLRQGHDLALMDEPNRWIQKFNGPMLFGVALVVGIVYWVLTGQDIVAMGVVVASMAIVVSGLVARGLSKTAVQIGGKSKSRKG